MRLAARKLGHLLEELYRAAEEEREPGRKVVYLEAPVKARLYVGDRVGQGEGHLLGGGASCLPHVVSGYGDGVPRGHLPGAVLYHVAYQPHGGLWRVDVRVACNVLLEYVVLGGPAQLLAGEALRLAHGDIVCQQGRGGGVDGHRGAHLAQWYPPKGGHHVADRRDGHAHLAHLALGLGRVGVVPYLGGQVEGHGQPGLPLLQHELEPLVGEARVPESGVLPHGPEAVPVHAGVYPAGIWVLAGILGGGAVSAVYAPHLEAGVGEYLRAHPVHLRTDRTMRSAAS